MSHNDGCSRVHAYQCDTNHHTYYNQHYSQVVLLVTEDISVTAGTSERHKNIMCNCSVQHVIKSVRKHQSLLASLLSCKSSDSQIKEICQCIILLLKQRLEIQHLPI